MNSAVSSQKHSFKSWLMAVSLFLFLYSFLSGCSSSREPIPAATPEPALFSSADEAIAACRQAAELTFDDICYDESRLAEFTTRKDSVIAALENDNLSSAQQENLYYDLCTAAEAMSPARVDSARIYIHCETDVDISTLSNVAELIGGEYGPCHITIVPSESNPLEAKRYDNCLIKERGNTSLLIPKHSFTLKLPHEDSLLGLNGSRRWILVSNNLDKTLLRNLLSYDLATALNCPETSQSVLSELYINDIYQGCYQLIEPIQTGREHLDIRTTRNEYLLELNSGREEEGVRYYETPLFGIRFQLNEPSVPSPDDLAYIEDFFFRMETALKDGDLSLIDMDSFVNCYLALEYTKNVDGMQYSTRFFIKDGKLYAGPLWDFDLSAGNLNSSNSQYYGYLNINGHGDNSGDSANGLWIATRGWYAVLFTIRDFTDALKNRFDEVYPILENLYVENKLGPSVIDRRLEEYYNLLQRNYSGTMWRIKYAYHFVSMDEPMTYDEHIQFLKDWYCRRLQYLSDSINRLQGQ